MDYKTYLLKLNRDEFRSLGVLAVLQEKTKADLIREGISLIIEKYNSDDGMKNE